MVRSASARGSPIRLAADTHVNCGDGDKFGKSLFTGPTSDMRHLAPVHDSDRSKLHTRRGSARTDGDMPGRNGAAASIAAE